MTHLYDALVHADLLRNGRQFVLGWKGVPLEVRVQNRHLKMYGLLDVFLDATVKSELPEHQ